MGNDLIGTLELLKTHRGTGTGSGPRQWDMWSFPLPSLGICQDFFLFSLLVVVFPLSLLVSLRGKRCAPPALQPDGFTAQVAFGNVFRDGSGSTQMGTRTQQGHGQHGDKATPGLGDSLFPCAGQGANSTEHPPDSSQRGRKPCSLAQHCFARRPLKAFSFARLQEFFHPCRSLNTTAKRTNPHSCNIFQVPLPTAPLFFF